MIIQYFSLQDMLMYRVSQKLYAFSFFEKFQIKLRKIDLRV